MPNFTSAVINGIGLWDQLDRYDDMNQYVQDELGALSDDIVAGSQFTPFGVAGQFGGAQMDANGNINYQAQGQEAMNAAARQGQANQLFNQAAGGYDQYQQDAYNDIRAMQMPEEQRAMAAQEQRLFAQGRGGMTTNQYGGSPEQLAMQKAMGENRNAAAVQAYGLGQSQQAQDATLGGLFQAAQYMPQAQMNNMFNQGLQGGQLTQAGQLAGTNAMGQLGLGGIQSQVNTEKIRADLMGGLFQQIGGAANDTGFDPLKSIFERFF